MNGEARETSERDVCCDRCGKTMYRTDGENVKVIRRIDSQGEHVLMPTRPLQIQAGNLKGLLCSKDCAVRWIEALPLETMQNGYPLWTAP